MDSYYYEQLSKLRTDLIAERRKNQFLMIKVAALQDVVDALRKALENLEEMISCGDDE